MKSIAHYEKLWILSLIPVLACISIFYLLPYVGVSNILLFQFSPDYIRFEKLASLASAETLKTNNYFDFIFIISYSLLFVVTLKLILRALEIKFFKKIILLAIIPGSVDVLENIFFLTLLEKQSQYFEIYYWLVRIKWTLSIVYIEVLLAIFLFYVVLSIYRFLCFFTARKKEKK